MTKQQVATPSIVKQIESIATAPDINQQLRQEIALGQAARVVKNDLKNNIALGILDSLNPDNLSQVLSDLSKAKDQPSLARPTTVRETMSSKEDSEFGRLAKAEIYDALTKKGITASSSIDEVKKALDDIRTEARGHVKAVGTFAQQKSKIDLQKGDSEILKQFGSTPQEALDASLKLLKAGVSSEKYNEIVAKINEDTDLGKKVATAISNISVLHLTNQNEKFALYQKANEFSPNNAKVLYGIGCCYQNGYGVEQDPKKRDESFQLAFQLYSKSIAVDPKNADTLYMLGLFHELGYGIPQNASKAISLFNDAIKINPAHYSAYFHLGQVYEFDLKNKPQAHSLYQTAYKLDPHCYEYYKEAINRTKG